jgi:regulatory protein
VSNNRDLSQKAKDYAILLLKFRARSEKEIYTRLKKKKFKEVVIKETLAFLKDKGFIDDKIFAKTWIESRLKKSLGLARLRQELGLKGIDKKIIDKAISQVGKTYSEEDTVAEIAEKRLRRLSNLEPSVKKRRVYAYLLRRGFSAEVVEEVVSQLSN